MQTHSFLFLFDISPILTCGLNRIVVLPLEKQHVFDRADPIIEPPLSYSKRDCRGILLLTTGKKYPIVKS